MTKLPVLVGCVAYHPRIVTIWEGFLPWFERAGTPTDYVLYSNYERLVDALLAGEVDIAWNTNTAYVAAEERIGGDAQVLAMRDVDADFATVIVTRRGEAFAVYFDLFARMSIFEVRDGRIALWRDRFDFATLTWAWLKGAAVALYRYLRGRLAEASGPPGDARN